ncbi:8-oxoguanine glycosylase ogg1 [Coemansia sp. RSA 989]|nr:8-oxoguanine glycosylase ogg1 [Coemansia sp. RSA 989]
MKILMLAKIRSSPWTDLCIKPAELRLDPTLTCGQAFRWRLTGAGEYTCALWDYAIDLKQTPTSIHYRVLGQLPTAHVDVAEALRDYFQLHISFDSLCDSWAQADADFTRLRQTHMGVRTLRQPVVETLLVFIASSNNNIKRISMLANRLSEHYGQAIETEKGIFHTFPSLARLNSDPQIAETLSRLGFGYRAKYYANTVRALCAEHSDPEQFLLGLRTAPLSEARAQLLKLSGVGPKVADCVCLMALDKTDAVPVDTHIWQVAQRRYVSRILDSKQGPEMLKLLPTDHQNKAMQLARQLKSTKAPNAKTYQVAQQLFVHLFGKYAGWAQGLLFSGDLGHETKPSKRKNQQTAANKESKMRLRSTK